MEELDQYLTAKVSELVHGALVFKRATGGLDPKTGLIQYDWVLQQPEKEDLLLGKWYDAARNAIKLYCRKLRAEGYKLQHADDYPPSVVRGDTNGSGQGQEQQAGGGPLQDPTVPAGEAEPEGEPADHHLVRRGETPS